MMEFNPTIIMLFTLSLITVLWLRFSLRRSTGSFLARQSQSMYAGWEVARRMLDNLQLQHAVIKSDADYLEHYDTSSITLHLTPRNYWNCSILSYACIAHAIGRLMQKSLLLAAFMRFAHQLTGFAAAGCVPFIFLGVAVGKMYFVNTGLLLFLSAVAVRMAFTPLHMNANKEGIRLLDSVGVISSSELPEITNLMSRIAFSHTAALLGDLLRPFNLLFIRRRKD